jgi:drug/metabolite transporter (DMT)-like permease
MAAIVLRLALGLSGRWVDLPGHRIRNLFLIGLLANSTLGITWFAALSLSPAWLVSLVVAMLPLAISTASWLIRSERFEMGLLPALAAVLLGGVALFWRPLAGAALTGVLLMLLNMAINVVYILAGQAHINPSPPVVPIFWLVCGATLGTFVYSLFSGQLRFDFQPIGWLWSLGFAILSTVLAITFNWWGIRLLGPARSSIIGSIDPVFSITFAVTLLGERLIGTQILGGALILAGVMWVRVQSTLQPQAQKAAIPNSGEIS